MRIAEFAERAGISPRALRHCEEVGLLVPERTAGGYRDYDQADLGTVRRIRVILDAGLGADVARVYLDCIGAGDERAATVSMCPALRAEMRRVEERLDRDSARIARTRAGLADMLSPESCR